MKKVLFAALALALIAALSFLPKVQVHVLSEKIDQNAAGVTRMITDTHKFTDWWPGQKQTDSSFTLGKQIIQIQEVFLNNISLSSERNGLRSDISISVSGETKGSSVITIHSTSRFSENPLRRILQYLAWPAMRSEHKHMALKLKEFFSDPDKVYGYKIESQQVKEASLISVRQQFDHDPSTEEIYALIEELSSYILKQGAKETGLPMLNVFVVDGDKHLAMVAIATDRDLAATDRYVLKKMLLNGNILVAEVQGGKHAIDACLQAVEHYVKDQNKMSPAMPFQRIITNRMTEKDTSKWITTINYPVF